MTNDEWDGVSALLENWWPATDYTETNSWGYRLALDEFTADEVKDALKKLLTRGDQFRPSASVIYATARGDHGVPSWAEAWPLIERAMKMREASDAFKFLEEHPAVLAFYKSKKHAFLRSLPLDAQYGDPHEVQKVLNDLRWEWKDFAERAEDNPAVIERALERGDDRGGGLRRPSLNGYDGRALTLGQRAEQGDAHDF